MAALVDRSPCAASRGGSTTKRVRSRSRGNSPAAIRFSSRLAMRDWKSAKRFMDPDLSDASQKAPARRKRGPLSQVETGVKKAGVFGDREPIGHAGDIVGDGPRPISLARLGRPLGGHGGGVTHISLEQAPHDRVRLFADPFNFRMVVHVSEEKGLDLAVRRLDGGGMPDKRSPGDGDRLGAINP